jgi:putative addiction module component (TIGR02574 family)
MARARSDLQREIDQLGPAERAQLLKYLIEKVDAPADTDVLTDWLAESERRLDEYEAGKARTYSASEFVEEARARYK